MAVPVLLAAGHNDESATTVINFTPTAGKDVLVFASVAAQIVGPTPWVEVTYQVNNVGVGWWRLLSADNDGSPTTVTFTHNGPRQCSYIVLEDEIDGAIALTYPAGEASQAGVVTTKTLVPQLSDVGGFGAGVTEYDITLFGVAWHTVFDLQIGEPEENASLGTTRLGFTGRVPASNEESAAVVYYVENPNFLGEQLDIDHTGPRSSSGSAVGFAVLTYNQEGATEPPPPPPPSGQVDYNIPTVRRTIEEENALAGASSSQWAISGLGDPNNLGFMRNFSAEVGDTAEFAVDGPCEVIDIYRIGWYGGLGWRRAATLTNTPTDQAAAAIISGSNGAVDCAGWTTTATWVIPEFSTPGLYVAVIRNVAGNNASWAPFVVYDRARDAALVYKTSDTTWALAYNRYSDDGNRYNGGSFYTGPGLGQWSINGRVWAASYNRPIVSRADTVQTYWLACEAPLIRFLERNGFDMNYISCRELDEDLVGFPTMTTLISSGHDEYWSQGMRDSAIDFRDEGGHLVFMSANSVFWRIRFDATRSIAWCYKDTMNNGVPLDPVSWTGTWKDTRWVDRAPENTLIGTDFRMNGINDLDVTIDAESYGSHPFWRSTTVAEGTDLTLFDVVGFEADSVLPTETAHLLAGAATINIDGSYADDNGQNYSGNGDLDWGIVFQGYSSGAIVAGFATNQWAWALDATHDRNGGSVSIQAQQATYNLFKDLGGDATSRMAGLVEPSAVDLATYYSNSTPPPPSTGAQLYVVIDGALVPIN